MHDYTLSAAVKMLQSHPTSDHFAGVREALTRREVSWVDRHDVRHTDWVDDSTRVVLAANCEHFRCTHGLRAAQRRGLPTLLLMDGMLEWRNTFVNPRPGPAFLKPAPVTRVLCGGEIDALALRALGNDALVTGLPRIGVRPRATLPAPSEARVLIATANTPWFTPEERPRLLRALARLRDALAAMGVPALWRVSEEAAWELCVERDAGTLDDALAACCAVVTTPSTLMIEAMRSGRPTALLHPHAAPLWQPCAWVWRGGEALDADGAAEVRRRAEGPHAERCAALDAQIVALCAERGAPTPVGAAMPCEFGAARSLIDALLSPDAARVRAQERALDLLHTEAVPAPEAVADVLASLATESEPHSTRHAPRVTVPSPVRLPAPRPRTPTLSGTSSRPRVLNVIFAEDSPVGGVTTWQQRLAREFARRDLGYEVRTLAVGFSDLGLDDDLTDSCVLDPTDDRVTLLRTVREAVERLQPDVIVPNYTDIAYVPAMQLRAAGIGGRPVRVVCVAHTDDGYYRRLAETYDRWDAGVAVSREIFYWLRRIGAGRPVHQIVYGVPVAASPRHVEPSIPGAPPAQQPPLRLAYVGRMIEDQKRISDLLHVVAGLEKRAVRYELHMVGDGPHLHAWRQRLDAQPLAHGRVVLHGRQTPGWVQGFLPTVDCTLLTSVTEGASISMLEAMGHGVVPVVTDIASGVAEWVRDGENGVLVPVGEPDAMAVRLSQLAHHRDRLARLSRAAWDTVREAVSIPAMADAYRAAFDDALRSTRDAERDLRPSDCVVRLVDEFRWRDRSPAACGDAEAYARCALTEAGFRHIALDTPAPGCDAVLVRPGTRPTRDQIARWRTAAGLGVVVLPHMMDLDLADELHAVLESRLRPGARRIAVFGIGNHTHRARGLFARGLPIVGFIDDKPPPAGTLFGLPVVPAADALRTLRPDAVLLSSDAWEPALWERSRHLRRAGVQVIPVYGQYTDPPALADASVEPASRPEAAAA